MYATEERYFTPRQYDSYDPSKSYREHNPYTIGYQSLKQDTSATKPTKFSSVEGIYARICPDRPMSAINFAQKTAELNAGKVWHKDNRGLRSEGKFQKFMDKITEVRMSSEALLQKHSEEMYDMHDKPAEKVDLKDYMKKNYLQIELKDKRKTDNKKKAINNVELAIQAKNFKIMKKTLDQIEYEKNNPKKVVKYMTGKTKVDPSTLAQPKFISYEYKAPVQQRAAPLPSQRLTFDQAMHDFVNLNVVPLPTEPSHEEEILEHNIDKIKQFQETLSSVERSSSAHRMLRVVTSKEELNNMPKKPSHFKRPPKSAHIRKTTHKKFDIEMRTQAYKPLDDFFSTAPQEGPQSAVPAQGKASPVPAMEFSALKMELNLSIFGVKSADLPKTGDSRGIGIFGNTHVDESKYGSPLRRVQDSGIDDVVSANIEDAGNEMLFKKQEKIKKILQASPQGKHIRVPNDMVLLKERYNVQIESLVNPQNASKVAMESKAMFFKDLIGEGKVASPRVIDKTRLHVYNSYKRLSQACESNEKDKPNLQSALQKGFKNLDYELRRVNGQFSVQEDELNNQIKKDILLEMQNSVMMPVRVRPKSRKVHTGESKK